MGGGRRGGSLMIWCCELIEECLYLCPRRWPIFYVQMLVSHLVYHSLPPCDQRRTDFTGEVEMNCVWKLKGLGPAEVGVAALTATSGRADSDILLVGRRGEAASSGLRKARSREGESSPMSFQLPEWLPLLERDRGRSRSMSSSTSSSGGRSRLGGMMVGRPDAMTGRGKGRGRRGGGRRRRKVILRRSLMRPGVGGGPRRDRKPVAA